MLGIVLAGGEGKRLYPLTADRAKPAVPFGGGYRLIDFVLSNLVNARFLRICVLTQYKSHSLDRHISQNWRLSGLAGEYITPVPAQQRLGPRWYTGSADAIYQSLNLIYDEDPDYIVVFGADHVYRMDPEQMVQFHIESGAGSTVAGIRVPRVHAVDVIGAEHDDQVRLLVVDQIQRLVDRIGRAGVPLGAKALLGRHRGHVVAEQVAHPPGSGDVAVQAVALVLGEDRDPQHPSVDEVRQREVDHSIQPAERDGRFGPVEGQR